MSDLPGVNVNVMKAQQKMKTQEKKAKHNGIKKEE